MSSSPCHVFKTGKHQVKLLSICSDKNRSFGPSPPKPLLVSTPLEEGEYPVVMFLHGYLLYNSFYSQLLQHVSSHGFIVVAPQLYTIAGPDSFDEIASAAETTDWLIHGLAHILPGHVRPDIRKVAIAGHSRGGKAAFALALGSHAKTKLTFSALMAVDPVDGTDKGKQTNPPILSYIPGSLNLGIAAMVIGSGLGCQKKNLFFPPCAPKGVSHQEFFDECCSPACHLVAKDYGHMDLLDDETKGIRGRATYCLCVNGKQREPMRSFVGGAMVAFMKAYLDGEMQDFLTLRDNPQVALPVEVSYKACFRD